MNLLLDTHALIWWVSGSKRLGPRAKAELSVVGGAPRISVVSIWEISIKSALGRLEQFEPPEIWLPELLRSGARIVTVDLPHTLAVRRLPHVHRDPFDRMLVAQAQCEGLTIVTADPHIREYPVATLNAEE